MDYVILFVVIFTTVFVLYLITVILNRKSLAKFSKSNQALILINKYKLKIDKENTKELALKIALANSLIIATAITIIEFVDNIILKLLVALIVMIPLIIICYKLIAKSMKKEGK